MSCLWKNPSRGVQKEIEYNNLEFKRLSPGVTIRETATKAWGGRGSHEVEGRRGKRLGRAQSLWNSTPTGERNQRKQIRR